MYDYESVGFVNPISGMLDQMKSKQESLDSLFVLSSYCIPLPDLMWWVRMTMIEFGEIMAVKLGLCLEMALVDWSWAVYLAGMMAVKLEKLSTFKM